MAVVTFSRSALAVSAALLCSTLGLNAQAALFEDDDARRAIIDLRQKVDANQLRNADDVRRLQSASEKAVERAVERAVEKAAEKASEESGQLRRSVLELSNQIEQLRAEIARMRGQDEQLAREVAEVQRRPKDVSLGVDDRLRKFEPVKVTVDGVEFMADPAEVRDFDAALATMRSGDFGKAQSVFVDFLRRYPVTGYKASALFWLGNAQYAVKNYRDAVTNFRSLLASAPDHLRAPEAVLAIANCQVELKEPKAAVRKTLDDLVKAYPQSEAATVAKDRLSKLK